MLSELGNRLGCGLLNLLRHAVVPITCPKCKHQFKPFANHHFTRFSEIMGRFPCPKCSVPIGLGEDEKSARETARFNPPGPLDQPATTRIERRTPSADELLFHIPPSGRAGMLAFFAFVWNAMMLPTFYFLVVRGFGQQMGPPLSLRIFISVFAAVGLGLAYASLRQKFASHLLYLSPELIRMQRLLLFRSNYDLKPVDVVGVKLVEFYSQNGTPVHGIEIGAGTRRIRFGSALAQDEKAWLAWEIRNFLRQHGATQLPPEAS